MVGLRRGDEGVLTFDVRGTAFDSSADGEIIVVAGYRSLTVVLLGSPSTMWLKLRTNRQLVKHVRFNPCLPNIFSCISGQNVDVFELTKKSIVQKLVSFTAHSRKISDFNWCSNDPNLMVCCADHDTVSFWDLRDTTKPCLELDLVFGANQAKFSPFHSNLMLSTHGCDMRLWDLRHTIQPINQFTGHEFRIQCLQWHPNEKNSFATSAINGLVKVWDMTEQKSVPNVVSIGSANAWRMMYSPEGDELACISIPANADSPNSLNIFTNSAMENPQPLKNENDDIIIDICWQKQVQKSTKYLYTLSKKNRLCRHLVSYEMINEARDEMATPIAQSAVDEERDRLIAEHADETAAAIASFEDSSGIIFGDATKKNILYQNPKCGSIFNFNKYLKNNQLNNVSALSSKKLPTLGFLISDTVGLPNAKFNNQQLGSITLQSPIVSEWSRWITAPNKTGGDLLTELEAIRKPLIDEMYTTEVNFQRAAIGFSYMHWNKCRKINFEMRFHKYFIDNGLVFVEVLQKDSPLSPEKATLFLTLLQHESNEQAKIDSESTILSRVFLRLPKLVESLKVFTPSINVPNAQKTTNSSLSSSYNEKRNALPDGVAEDSSDVTMSSSLKPSAVVPVTYTPSPFDHFVPAPRNCGGRFNGSGFLVTFGRVYYGFSSLRARISKTSVCESSSTINILQQHLDKQQSSSDYSSTISSYRRRSFHQHSSVNSRRSGEPLHNSIISSNVLKKDDFINPLYFHPRQSHQYPSSSSDIPRVIANYPTVISQFTRGNSSLREQCTINRGVPLNRFTTAVNTLEHSSHHKHKHHLSSSRYSSWYNPRSLADYCISVFVPQQQIFLPYQTDIHTVKRGAYPRVIFDGDYVTKASSLTTDAFVDRNKSLSTQEKDFNRNLTVSSCSTSPSLSSNLFSSSTNTMIALTLPQISHTASSVSSSCASIFVLPATESTSSKFTQPLMISSAAVPIQRNNSIKSVPKVLSSSPNTCKSCSPSGTTRSFSLQNVSQSSRHRGNSMTIMSSVKVGDAALMTTASGIVVNSGGNVPNAIAPLMIMEEHAVMPEPSFSSTVTVYDALGLLPISKDLATKYKLLGGNALELCRYNLKQSINSSRHDLIRVWKLLEQCISSLNNQNFQSYSRQSFNRTSWALHPFGRSLINNLLNHYNSVFDIQTVAMISCILGNRHMLSLRSFGNSYTSGDAFNTHPRYKCSIAGRPKQPNFTVNSINNSDQSTLFSSSFYSRCLSASLASSNLPNSQPQNMLRSVQNHNYQHQLTYEQNFEISNTYENHFFFSSKLTRSSSFENENQSLVIPVDESKVGSAVTGPPSRKPSSSFGLTPTLQAAVSANPTAVLSTLSTIVAVSNLNSKMFELERCKQTRVNSVPPYKVEQPSSFAECSINYSCFQNESNGSNELLLDPELDHRFESIRLQYADILYRWGMYLKCAEVMKYCFTSMAMSTAMPAPASATGVQSADEEVIGKVTEISWCGHCDECLRHTYKCPKCKRPPIFCAICEQPCYGVIVTCSSCSHGGHFSHMARWFETQSSCPFSCGCECKA